MGFVSQKFIDKRTGEIVVQVPISEICNFEEYNGHLEAGDVDQIEADRLADESETFETTIRISVDIDNDAFVDRLTEELQRILNASDIINRTWDEGPNVRVPLRDINGNTCGYAVAGDTVTDDCPSCGESCEVEGDSVDIESMSAGQDCHCLACGATWRSVYTLTHIVDHVDGEGVAA